MSHLRIRTSLSPAKIPRLFIPTYPVGAMWSRATRNMWCRAFDPTGCVTERRPLALGLVSGDQMINLMCSFLVALRMLEGLSRDRVPSLSASW